MVTDRFLKTRKLNQNLMLFWQQKIDLCHKQSPITRYDYLGLESMKLVHFAELEIDGDRFETVIYAIDVKVFGQPA